ncbi:MAG: ABC1 kinase family protein [Candidatus Brocadiia bacterium]
MNPLELGRAPRKVHRLGEIAAVLVRHGLSYFVRRLNLSRYLPRRKQLMAAGEDVALDRESVARRLTRVMEELGPTFVRLGQVLSSRPDLFEEETIREFERLQDRVAPFRPEEAKAIVARELGRPTGDLFASFDDEPFASGSLAQVHCAELPDGTEVVVKIKRPGVERLVLTDLSLLRSVVAYIERQVAELQVYQPRVVFEELERRVRRELDFVTEASNTARFHDALAEVEGVRCARVEWELTTSDVLTMERLRGVRITDLAALRERGVDPQAVAHRLAEVFLTQYTELGTFHGDPHPGNLLVCEDGSVGILDFAMVGRLTTELRNRLGALLIGIARRDVDVVAEVCFSLGLTSDEIEESTFKLGVHELLDKYYGMPLKRVEPRRVYGDVTALARECRIVLPRDFVMLAKSLVTVISIARTLDPEFDVAALLRPRARELLRQRLSPPQLARNAGLHAWGLATLVQALPRLVLRILRRAESGRLQLTFRHTGYEEFVSELDRAANRVTVSVILASIVIGSSLLLALKTQPLLFGRISFLGILGYLVAGVLGLWTVWGILRSGRL